MAMMPHELRFSTNSTRHTPGLPTPDHSDTSMQFMRDRLRIRDVRLYIRDLLKEYASLQKFKPKPNPLARCLDWERMLMEFEWPHYKEASAAAAVGCMARGYAATYLLHIIDQSNLAHMSGKLYVLLVASGLP